MFKNQQGVVIIAVLWICALIMWLGLQIAAGARLRGEEQVHILRKSQALHLAIGGCYEALARMGQPLPTGLETGLRRNQGNYDNWQPNGIPHIVRYGTGEAVVVVESENDKVNIDKANHDQLKAVLVKAGMDDDAADGLSDVIADFIDPDDMPRLRGAEKDRYQQLGIPYGPFNGLLTSPDQLLLVPGVTQRLFYGYGAGGDHQYSNESDLIYDSSFPRKYSLFNMISVYGSNELIKDEAATEAEEKIITWQTGGIYRILARGKPASGPPSVLVWLTVQYLPQSKQGYEILYRKIL
jgi:hypothetical protein